MMMDSEEEEEQTALVCDNGKFTTWLTTVETTVERELLREGRKFENGSMPYSLLKSK